MPGWRSTASSPRTCPATWSCDLALRAGSAPPTSPRLLHLGYSLLILCLNGRCDIAAEQVDLGEPTPGRYRVEVSRMMGKRLRQPKVAKVLTGIQSLSNRHPLYPPENPRGVSSLLCRGVSSLLCRGVSSLYCAYRKTPHHAQYGKFTLLRSRAGAAFNRERREGTRPRGRPRSATLLNNSLASEDRPYQFPYCGTNRRPNRKFPKTLTMIDRSRNGSARVHSQSLRECVGVALSLLLKKV
jgi:hypothetical protein